MTKVIKKVEMEAIYLEETGEWLFQLDNGEYRLSQEEFEKQGYEVAAQQCSEEEWDYDDLAYGYMGLSEMNTEEDEKYIEAIKLKCGIK